jgi:hypothetical protein
MANANPNPATRFGAGQTNGSRGRQKAARDKISAAFLEALNDTFHEPNAEGGSKGLEALKKVRDEDPISNLTDEQLEAYCAELERQVAERAARTTPTAAIVAICPGSQRMN